MRSCAGLHCDWIFMATDLDATVDTCWHPAVKRPSWGGLVLQRTGITEHRQCKHNIRQLIDVRDLLKAGGLDWLTLPRLFTKTHES